MGQKIISIHRINIKMELARLKFPINEATVSSWEQFGVRV